MIPINYPKVIDARTAVIAGFTLALNAPSENLARVVLDKIKGEVEMMSDEELDSCRRAAKALYEEALRDSEDSEDSE
tara:strand:- start:465 stop:695 length:231 start_codon:yes stop_codon:yes gene_type:complete